MVYLLALLLALTPLSAAAAAVPLAEVIRHTVEVYGGAAALERVAAVRERATLHPRIRHPGETARMVRLLDPKGRLRVGIRYSGGDHELRLLDHGHGWRDGRAVSGPMSTAMVLQAARLALPWLLARHPQVAVDHSTVTTARGTRRLLSLRLGPKTRIEAAIDPRSGHIVRTTGRIPMGSTTLTFTTVLSDFRRVGGLLFPFHEENHAQGQHTATTVIDHVDLLDQVDPGRFRPAPAGGRSL